MINWIRGFLWLALLLAAASFTELDDQWQVMVLPPVAPGVAAGNAGLLHDLLSVWHALIHAMADIGLISDASGHRIITQGFSSGALLRAFAALSCLVTLILSMLLSKPAAVTSSSSVPAEPFLGSVQDGEISVRVDAVSNAITASELKEVQETLAQIQGKIADLLLDPQAQPLAEPLSEVGRELESAHQALETAKKHLS